VRFEPIDPDYDPEFFEHEDHEAHLHIHHDGQMVKNFEYVLMSMTQNDEENAGAYVVREGMELNFAIDSEE
jgi:hypothetical protein